jgi:hypothetical protein
MIRTQSTQYLFHLRISARFRFVPILHSASTCSFKWNRPSCHTAPIFFRFQNQRRCHKPCSLADTFNSGRLCSYKLFRSSIMSSWTRPDHESRWQEWLNGIDCIVNPSFPNAGGESRSENKHGDYEEAAITWHWFFDEFRVVSIFHGDSVTDGLRIEKHSPVYDQFPLILLVRFMDEQD